MIVTRFLRACVARRRLSFGAAGVLVVLVTGCGPTVAPDLGVNSVPLDLVLGKPPAQAVTAPAPTPGPPPPLPQIGLPGFGLPSGLGFSSDSGFTGFIIPPAPTAPVCAAADPAKGSIEATTEVDNAPKNGTYDYRSTTDSTYSSGGASATRFPSNFKLIVSGAGPYTGAGNPSGQPGEYTFNQSQQLVAMTVASTFQSQNTTSNPAGPFAGEQTSQLGLASMSIALPGQGTLTFNAPPGKALDVLKTPANSSLQGNVNPTGQTSGSPPSWQDAISDASDGSSMSINAAVTATKPVQVNACGQDIDAWPVTATITFTAGPPAGAPVGAATGATNLTWTVNYDVATGLGGLIVHEDGGTSCAAQPGGQPCQLDGQPYSSTFNFTTSVASPVSP